ncbi:MAG: PilZ domain-containing protein [Candidatus Obscuribacterales bacterium]|nr:PilZ domain-containing protein [Candidatus Obscuribacterales bacterium]
MLFQPGKVLKVKVESSPGEIGFGRAAIIDRVGSQILVQVRTSRDSNKILPKGTKIWFVSDSPRLTFNGMWSSSVMGTQLLKGRTCLLCSAPKLEPASQKRKSQRVMIDVPVTISLDIGGKEKQEFRTVDLCRSGSAIETSRIDHLDVETGREIKAVLHTQEGDVSLTARVLRVEHNWLANKTSLALEFIALPQESSEILDKVLVRLGGRPRDAELDKESAGTREGMSAWMQQVKKTPLPDLSKSADSDESSEEIGVAVAEAIDPDDGDE